MAISPALPLSRHRSVPALVWQAGAVASGALLLGGVTSIGQTFLPDAVAPLANSASGWTICVVALLLLLPRLSAVVSAMLGALGFAGLTLGYTLVSEARGFPFSPDFWLAVGLIAGPIVGLAVWAARSSEAVHRAVGLAVIAGILGGEGLYGLAVVSNTTGITYWIAMLVVSGALLIVGAARMLRDRESRLILGAVATCLIAAFPLAYLGLAEVMMAVSSS